MIITYYFALLLLRFREMLNTDKWLTACNAAKFGRYITTNIQEECIASTDRINYSEDGGNKFLRNRGPHLAK